MPQAPALHSSTRPQRAFDPLPGLPHWAGEPREPGFVLMPGLIGLHMAARVFHPLRGERVAHSKVTGKQHLPVEKGLPLNEAAAPQPGR